MSEANKNVSFDETIDNNAKMIILLRVFCVCLCVSCMCVCCVEVALRRVLGWSSAYILSSMYLYANNGHFESSFLDDSPVITSLFHNETARNNSVWIELQMFVLLIWRGLKGGVRGEVKGWGRLRRERAERAFTSFHRIYVLIVVEDLFFLSPLIFLQTKTLSVVTSGFSFQNRKAHITLPLTDVYLPSCSQNLASTKFLCSSKWSCLVYQQLNSNSSGFGLDPAQRHTKIYTKYCSRTFNTRVSP